MMSAIAITVYGTYALHQSHYIVPYFPFTKHFQGTCLSNRRIREKVAEIWSKSRLTFLSPKMIQHGRRVNSDVYCELLCLVTQSCPILCDAMDCSLPGSSVHGDSPDKNTGVGYYAFPQGIFQTQQSNPGLQHCRRILYCLSHQGSLRILEQVAYPFSRGSSPPRNQTGVSCIAGRFFTSWANL